MDFKRIFKTPLFWVLAVIVVMLTVFSFDGSGGYTTVTTAQAEKLITDKKVESAVMTTENVLTLDLRPGQTFSDSAADISGATKVQTDYVDARAEQLIDALKACPSLRSRFSTFSVVMTAVSTFLSEMSFSACAVVTVE